MLSPSDNELLTRVGAGTPAGDLLRRYWHPLCPAAVLDSPTAVFSCRILGESLVVYRTPEGAYSAIEERCPHRGASLAYGFVEDGGIRCPYHGWLFDRAGHCVERPFEASGPQSAITTRAYEVIERAGLLFVYMGPEASKTPMPIWDILPRTDGQHHILLQDDLACNWLQVQENTADVTHTFFLHSYMAAKRGDTDVSGYDLPMKSFGFQPFAWGLLKTWAYEDPSSGETLEGWGNPLIFPNMMRIDTEMHWRVPIDDYSTRIIILQFEPGRPRRPIDIRRVPPRNTPDGRYMMDTFFSQDAMAWETQGAIYDRSTEHLGASDVGVSMYRDMLREQIERVSNGARPMATGEEPEAIVNQRVWMSGYLPMSAPADPTPTERKSAEEIFDDRFRRYDVPAGKARQPIRTRAVR